MTGVSGDGDWFALGFGNGQSADSAHTRIGFRYDFKTSTGDRFDPGHHCVLAGCPLDVHDPSGAERGSKKNESPPV